MWDLIGWWEFVFHFAIEVVHFDHNCKKEDIFYLGSRSIKKNRKNNKKTHESNLLREAVTVWVSTYSRMRWNRAKTTILHTLSGKNNFSKSSRKKTDYLERAFFRFPPVPVLSALLRLLMRLLSENLTRSPLAYPTTLPKQDRGGRCSTLPYRLAFFLAQRFVRGLFSTLCW